MTKASLEATYRAYIACLNTRAWMALGDFVADDACHNGKPLGVPGYRAMLENDVAEIPDLHFGIGLLAVDPPTIAARLEFNCAPSGTFLGLPVNGKRVSFTENVFYEFRDGKISKVWSVVDAAAIKAQL